MMDASILCGLGGTILSGRQVTSSVYQTVTGY